MKKFIAALFVVASIAAVSCNKDDKGGSTKTDEGGIDTSLPTALQHSAFIPVVLDGTSFESIKDKVVVDLRVDDKTNNLWVWDKTYTGGAGEGLNFFGNTEGYIDLLVGTVGWSGAGFCVYTSFTPEGAEEPFVAAVDPFEKINGSIGADPANWVFHLAYKGEARVAHIIILTFGTKKYTFAIGEGSLEDSGVSYNAIAPVSGEFEAGEWMEYEIPVQDLGIDFTAKDSANGTNVVTLLSGGVTGTEIKLDAVYYYKK